MPRKKTKNPKWLIALAILIMAGGFWAVYRYWTAFQYRYEFEHADASEQESLKFRHVFYSIPDGVLGLDISQYQDKIRWEEFQLNHQNELIEFIVVRATFGKDQKDIQFERNWKNISELPVKKGAYHYYRPNENSTLQAENFIKTVKLSPGDFPPILDIERQSTIQTNENLRKGIRNWLAIVEAHYGVKPIIYTGDSYFRDNLDGNDFQDYPLWIANYNLVRKPKTNRWVIWQFSEKGEIPGIKGKVDLNVLRGGKNALDNLLISE